MESQKEVQSESHEEIQSAEVVSTTREINAILIAPDFMDEIIGYLKTRPIGDTTAASLFHSLSQAKVSKVIFQDGTSL